MLLAKHEALEVLTGHRSTDLKVSADPSKKDPLSQPSFCEMLAAIAIYIGMCMQPHTYMCLAI